MTAEAKEQFLSEFAKEYDLPGAAARAKLSRTEAYALLAESDCRAVIDRTVMQRMSDEMLGRIAREYERMAFGDGEELRPSDRMRALEQLRLIASSGTGGRAPTLRVHYGYV